MSTLNDLEKIYINDLRNIYPKQEIKSIFKLLILDLFKIDSIFFLLIKYDIVSLSKEKKIIDYLNRLQKYEPVQYILGYTIFLDLKIKLNKKVLIPRKETEELVIWCKSFLNKENKIIDLGTGSGCIAISLAKYNKVIALDKCNNSLKTAKLNAKNNNLNNLLKFEHTNGNKVFNKTFYAKFDLIVANIISSELSKLAQDIAKYLGNNCYLVLSGILKSQENSIINKFKNFNLLLVRKHYVENWVTILMIKKDRIH